MRIALIGSAPSSVNLGPYRDASYSAFLGGKPAPQYPPSEFIDDRWKIWGCSPGAWAVVPRADCWFELHRWEPGQPWFSPEYLQFMREFRGPVYTGGPVEELPNGTVYPIAEVEAEFSSYFLTSSLSLMLALAILEIEKVRKARAERAELMARVQPVPLNGCAMSPVDETEDTIGLWGVDMSAGEEYAAQRPGCQFFILEALRRGIGVHVPPESDLLRPRPVYGLSEWDHNYIKATARMRELISRRDAANQAIAANTQQAQFIAGAVDNMNYMIETWFSPYGIPAGCRISIEPGTGLGGGMTLAPPPALHQFATPGAAEAGLAEPALNPAESSTASTSADTPSRVLITRAEQRAAAKAERKATERAAAKRPRKKAKPARKK